MGYSDNDLGSDKFAIGFGIAVLLVLVIIALFATFSKERQPDSIDVNVSGDEEHLVYPNESSATGSASTGATQSMRL